MKIVKDCIMCELARQRTGLVLDTQYWHVVVSYDQGYFGRCLVIAHAHKPSLSMLSDSEWWEFNRIAPILEHATKTAFGATNFNWECLMNDAFQAKRPLPHVHWHFRPRYRQPVEFEGQTFADPSFGHRADPNHRRRIEPEQQNVIAVALKGPLDSPLRRPFI